MNYLQEETLSSRSEWNQILEKEKNEKNEISIVRSHSTDASDAAFKFYFFIDTQKLCYVSDNKALEIPLSNFGHIHLLSQLHLPSKKKIMTCSAQKLFDGFRIPPSPAFFRSSPPITSPQIKALRERYVEEIRKGDMKAAMQIKRAIEGRENQPPTSPTTSTRFK